MPYHESEDTEQTPTIKFSTWPNKHPLPTLRPFVIPKELIKSSDAEDIKFLSATKILEYYAVQNRIEATFDDSGVDTFERLSDIETSSNEEKGLVPFDTLDYFGIIHHMNGTRAHEWGDLQYQSNVDIGCLGQIRKILGIMDPNAEPTKVHVVQKVLPRGRNQFAPTYSLNRADDIEDELDRFNNGGFDAMSDYVTANLDRDPEYKAWYNKLHSIKGDEIEISLEDLDFETLKNSFPNNYQKEKFTRPQTDEPYYEDAISFPNLDDSSMEIGDSSALEDYKSKIGRFFGNVTVVLKPDGKNWFDKVFIDDDEFNAKRDEFIRGKASAIQRDMDAGKTIDEIAISMVEQAPPAGGAPAAGGGGSSPEDKTFERMIKAKKKEIINIPE